MDWQDYKGVRSQTVWRVKVREGVGAAGYGCRIRDRLRHRRPHMEAFLSRSGLVAGPCHGWMPCPLEAF